MNFILIILMPPVEMDLSESGHFRHQLERGYEHTVVPKQHVFLFAVHVTL